MSDLRENLSNKESTEHSNSEDEKQKSKSEVAATMTEQPEVEGILEKLDPDERELISATISYSGPLPPPDYLKGYVDVYPKSAEMIFGWVDQERDHRQKMDELHMNKSFKANRLGVILGFILMLTFIIGGILLIFLDKEVYGLTLMVPVIGTVVGLLVRGRKKKKDNNDDSNKE